MNYSLSTPADILLAGLSGAGNDVAHTAIEDALAQAWMVQESNFIDPKELDATKRINWDILRDWVHAKGYNFEELFASSGDSVAAKAALE